AEPAGRRRQRDRNRTPVRASRRLRTGSGGAAGRTNPPAGGGAAAPQRAGREDQLERSARRTAARPGGKHHRAEARQRRPAGRRPMRRTSTMTETHSLNHAQPVTVSLDEATLLDRIVDNFTPDANQRPFARDIIADFAQQVLDGSIVYARDTESMVKTRIA